MTLEDAKLIADELSSAIEIEVIEDYVARFSQKSTTALQVDSREVFLSAVGDILIESEMRGDDDDYIELLQAIGRLLKNYRMDSLGFNTLIY